MFNSLAKHMWTLNQTLEDEIGSDQFVPDPYFTSSVNPITSLTTSVPVVPTYGSYVWFNVLTQKNEIKYGLEISDYQEYISESDSYLSDSLTLAFWYYSPGPIGYTKHAVTRDNQTRQAPLLSSAIFNVSNDPITARGLFVISEIAASNNQNKIRFVVFGSDGITPYTVESYPYDPGIHHVLVTYSSEQYKIRIDIDGKRGIEALGGTALSSSYLSSMAINSLVPDYASHIVRQNTGFISDLIFTESASDANEAIRIMRYGWQYLADEELSAKKFKFFGFSFPRQTVVSSNQVITRSGNIYVVRSNGEIMKGNRPIWDNEYNYTNPDSLKMLNISEQDSIPDSGIVPANQRTAEWTPSGLKLNGTNVKV